MIKGQGLNLETIATSEDNREIPVQEKPKVDDNSPRDVIQYKDRIFEVPTDMIFYLADLPENLSARIDRTVRNGMGFMYPDGGHGYHYCNHYGSNIANMFSAGGQDMIIHNTEGDPGISVNGCQYKRAEDVRWATRFQHKDSGAVVMAQKTPCVVNDSMIAQLAESGALDEFEVKDREFQYSTLAELMEKPELQKQYELQPAKRSVLGRAYDLMRNVFSG